MGSRAKSRRPLFSNFPQNTRKVTEGYVCGRLERELKGDVVRKHWNFPAGSVGIRCAEDHLLLYGSLWEQNESTMHYVKDANNKQQGEVRRVWLHKDPHHESRWRISKFMKFHSTGLGQIKTWTRHNSCIHCAWFSTKQNSHKCQNVTLPRMGWLAGWIPNAPSDCPRDSGFSGTARSGRFPLSETIALHELIMQIPLAAWGPIHSNRLCSLTLFCNSLTPLLWLEPLPQSASYLFSQPQLLVDHTLW